MPRAVRRHIRDKMVIITRGLRKGVWRLLRSFFFLFEAETAHNLSLRMLKLLGDFPLRIVSGSLPSGNNYGTEDVNPRVFEIEFMSRVGLAAGFDKNGEILTALPQLGFGFAEIGTVTPRAQLGNPRPRLFRDLRRESLLNRMGFNGLGSEKVARNVAKARELLPERFRIGVNLGKNRDTPLEDAAEDYVKAAIPFRDLADYLVVNVSSPNTPGLRSLQNEDVLRPILDKIVDLISGWNKKPPLMLKLAPELNEDALAALIGSLELHGVDGWVLTNTLAGTYQDRSQTFEGGWSGRVLTKSSRKSLIHARRYTSAPIISVGGVLSEAEAQERILLGADLIQIYSGWIYRGPSFPWELSQRLRSLEMDGPKKEKPQT